MNKQQIERRIEELTAMEKKIQDQGIAELQAIAGAKQDCQYWLGQASVAEAGATLEPQLMVPTPDAKAKPGRKKKSA
jgi:hypothetical protein